MLRSSRWSSSLEDFVPPIRAETALSGAVQVWRLPPHLSQSRLGDRQGSSNACTIIALKMAECVQQQCLVFPAAANHCSALLGRAVAGGSALAGGADDAFAADARHYGGGACVAATGVARACTPQSPPATAKPPAPLALMNALANSIIDGNAIHEEAMRRRSVAELNFTIPDAIGACGGVFVELDFATARGSFAANLVQNVRRAVRFWDERLRCGGAVGRPPLLLLVIAYERSVLLVYQPDDQLLGAVDSHSHADAGALLAAAPLRHVGSFAGWIRQHLFPEALAGNASRPEEFEISAVVLRSAVGRADLCRARIFEQSARKKRPLSPDHFDAASKFARSAF